MYNKLGACLITYKTKSITAITTAASPTIEGFCIINDILN